MMTKAEHDVYQLSITIHELCSMASDRLWQDDDIKDRHILAALVDGAKAAALLLHESAGSMDIKYHNETVD